MTNSSSNTIDNDSESKPILPSTLPLPSSLASTLIPNLPPSIYYIPSFVSPDEEAALLQRVTSAPLPTWKTLSHRRLQAYPSVLSQSNTLIDAPLPPWLREPIVSRLLAIPVQESHLKGTSYVPNEEGGGENDFEQPSAHGGNIDIFSNSPHGAPNHCLVNEYLPGQGILPHEDGNAYWPVVCTVSLGSHTVLNISRKRSKADFACNGNDHLVDGENEEQGLSPDDGKWRILQERRSLLISTGEVYTDFLHGIEPVLVDEGLGAESIANWDALGNKGEYVEGKRERETRISLTFRDVLKVKTLGRAFGALKR